MSDITPDEAQPRPRTGLFWTTWLLATAAAFFVSIGGGAVTPVTNLWAAPPPAAAPVTPVEPGEPGEPAAPSEPVAADACETGTAGLTLRVCALATAAGWVVNAPEGEIVQGTQFTLTTPGGEPVLAVNDAFEQVDIAKGEVLTLSHTHDGLTTAGLTPLPAQSDASMATDIRAALGVDEIWFFDGARIVDGPSLSFGSGWSVATPYDASRAVGDTVTVGWVTLTVDSSTPGQATLWTVS